MNSRAIAQKIRAAACEAVFAMDDMSLSDGVALIASWQPGGVKWSVVPSGMIEELSDGFIRREVVGVYTHTPDFDVLVEDIAATLNVGTLVP